MSVNIRVIVLIIKILFFKNQFLSPCGRNIESFFSRKTGFSIETFIYYFIDCEFTLELSKAYPLGNIEFLIDYDIGILFY